MGDRRGSSDGGRDSELSNDLTPSEAAFVEKVKVVFLFGSPESRRLQMLVSETFSFLISFSVFFFFWAGLHAILIESR
jgi:hypothetical protein